MGPYQNPDTVASGVSVMFFVRMRGSISSASTAHTANNNTPLPQDLLPPSTHRTILRLLGPKSFRYYFHTHAKSGALPNLGEYAATYIGHQTTDRHTPYQQVFISREYNFAFKSPVHRVRFRAPRPRLSKPASSPRWRLLLAEKEVWSNSAGGPGTG